jgi:Flp pilus assembly protein TadG
VAVVFVLLVVVGLVAGAMALANALGGAGKAGPAAQDAGAAVQTASATASTPASTPATTQPANKPTPLASSVCDESGIKVSGSVDKTSYEAGADPKLTLRVTNTGQAPCDINVGTSQMEFKITSGNDVIFNSRDCQSGSSDLVKNLKPGASETANFTWMRNRSMPGCTKVAATPGAGTYVFVTTLGKWSSDKVVFALK